MLNWRLVGKTTGSFGAITFALCVVYGLVMPARFHAGWLLEAILPGFTWLTVAGFLLGVVEAALYGAWAGILFSALYNYFARNTAAAKRAEGRVVRAA